MGLPRRRQRDPREHLNAEDDNVEWRALHLLEDKTPSTEKSVSGQRRVFSAAQVDSLSAGVSAQRAILGAT